ADHKLFRKGPRTVLATTGAMSVSGEATTGREAFQLVDDLKPDIVTVDVTLPDGDGILATREILRRQPSTKVLMLTMHGNHYYLSQAIGAGARGYALKEQLPTEIVDALRAVARGELYVAPQLPQNMSAAPAGTRRGN